MVRTGWCLLIGIGLLASCDTGGGSSAEAAPNPATEIGPSPESAATATPGDDWPLPTGVYRAVTPKEGTLELHIEPGSFAIYVLVDGVPELGYAADCVPDEPSTVTCTSRDGYRIVYGWDGTDEELHFEVLSGGEQGDRDVWEPVPWTRVS